MRRLGRSSLLFAREIIIYRGGVRAAGEWHRFSTTPSQALDDNENTGAADIEDDDDVHYERVEMYQVCDVSSFV